jgi:short-subunit dehydrogenase
VKVLILGATSAIAEAVARSLAASGSELFLVGRNRERLAAVADDLRVRSGARVEREVADLDRLEDHEALVARADAWLGGIDLALVAHGLLGDPDATRRDGNAAARVLHTNLVSPASLLTSVANRMEARGSGVIVALSSVAGDRGRQSNYPYGAAKGGLSIFLQGLRNRLARSGVHVLTVKLGFVDTPMTAALPKNPLYARPEAVAAGILRAVRSRRDVVYLPWFWRWIMGAVRAVPERAFKRLRM